MKRILVASMLGCSFLAAASSAVAGQGYLVANVTLRAGPDFGYPAVVGLRAGTPVGIEGCVDGWSWCDVTNGYDRGWVSGNYLQQEYQGQRVLVPEYGVQIGIPIVTFVFGSYWDNYYSGRSWYGNREHWSHVHPHYASYGGSHGGSYGGSYGSSYSGSHNGSHGGSYGGSYSGSHTGSRGTSYGSSYSGSHATSSDGGSQYVAPDQARASSTYRASGSRHATAVTTQPTYQSGRSQTTYSSGRTQSASQGRQTGSVTHSQSVEGRQTGSVTHTQSVEGRQTGSVTHSQSVDGRHTGSVTHTGSVPPEGRNQSYQNHTTNVQQGSSESSRAAQHGNAQPRSVAEHKQQAPKAQHNDRSAKPEKDNGGGKDKNRN